MFYRSKTNQRLPFRDKGSKIPLEVIFLRKEIPKEIKITKKQGNKFPKEINFLRNIFPQEV